VDITPQSGGENKKEASVTESPTPLQPSAPLEKDMDTVIINKEAVLRDTDTNEAVNQTTEVPSTGGGGTATVTDVKDPSSPGAVVTQDDDVSVQVGAAIVIPEIVIDQVDSLLEGDESVVNDTGAEPPGGGPVQDGATDSHAATGGREGVETSYEETERTLPDGTVVKEHHARTTQRIVRDPATDGAELPEVQALIPLEL